MKKQIKQSFLSGLVFLGTVWIGFIGFAAWTDLPTQSNWDTLNSTIWNNLISKVNTIWAQVDTLWSSPAWAIMAFYLTSCPSWWLLADWTNGTPDLRWQFIRWASPNTTYDPDWASRSWWLGDSNKIWSKQTDQLKSHTHNYTYYNDADVNTAYDWWDGWNWAIARSTAAAWWTETRPTNTYMLYCMKQ